MLLFPADGVTECGVVDEGCTRGRGNILKIAAGEMDRLLRQAFAHHGVPEDDAARLAATITAAERDGTASHGLSRLPGYMSSLASGWVNANPAPTLHDLAPGLLHVDADNGFAQVALAVATPRLVEKARMAGVASLSISNSHHLAALWPDVEPFARQGFVALTVVNSRSLMVAWEGKTKILGTNPMAFACPRENGPPVVWDQASSVMSQGDLRLHARDGKNLPPGRALDRDGQPTTDPSAMLEGGALLPFGGAKGASIAFMAEVLAAALTGGRFGFEDVSAGVPGASSSNAGQFLLLIDAAMASGGQFAHRVEGLIAALRAAGSMRMPGDRRYSMRIRSGSDGIEISETDAATLHAAAAGR